MKRIAFQGELGAYSELASYAYFGSDIEVVPCTSFADTFEAVVKGRAEHGAIPIENSLTGSIHENYDLLLAHDLKITGEIKLRIVHNLIVNPGADIDSIRRIYSHPQALSQCGDFLQGLKKVELISVYDTAGAAKRIKADGTLDEAAVASEQAAIDYGLTILDSGIESNHMNFTRFLIISPELSPRSDESKTSIVFAARNIPGALFKSLSVFALRDIDLYKIESRPIPGAPWKYMFYLDFSGDVRDDTTKRAIGHLEEITSFLKILGSYRKGDEVVSSLHDRNRGQEESASGSQ